MKARFKPYGLVLAVALIELVLGFTHPALAWRSVGNSAEFLGEVLAVLPPVMLLMGLLDVWVPRRLVEGHLGPGSGLRGVVLAFLLGTAAAGPLYAAFPLAVSLGRKGARVANIAIFLGSWASIKIPMLVMESSFIGLRFALLRLAFTVPGVVAVGFLMERLVPEGGQSAVAGLIVEEAS
ncbi:MAG: permease [Humidesulfovibrio sp.]|nr:permease [Humidesulfovibrio sp.]